MYRVSPATYHLSPVTCHLSIMQKATATYPPAQLAGLHRPPPNKETKKSINHQNGEKERKVLGMPIITIRSLTRSLQSPGKRGFQEGTDFHVMDIALSNNIGSKNLQLQLGGKTKLLNSSSSSSKKNQLKAPAPTHIFFGVSNLQLKLGFNLRHVHPSIANYRLNRPRGQFSEKSPTLE